MYLIYYGKNTIKATIKIDSNKNTSFICKITKIKTAFVFMYNFLILRHELLLEILIFLFM